MSGPGPEVLEILIVTRIALLFSPCKHERLAHWSRLFGGRIKMQVPRPTRHVMGPGNMYLSQLLSPMLVIPSGLGAVTWARL